MSKRFIVYDRQLRPLFDLDGRITEATRYERINGEHKLDIKTTQPLEEGMRILVHDGTLKWREWVIDEPQEHKQNYDIVEGSYGCTWSMQYDLSRVSGGELWPGTYTPITAGAALAMVLATQKRWEVGRVTVAGTAGTSLFDGSVWEYLGKLQEVWGGEMEPRIEVDSNGVTHRYVDWLEHVGNTEAVRRFDYGDDCTSIDRKPPVGPMCCRIVPRGGHDATDEDGISYSERVGVEEEPYSSGDGWVHDAGSVWIRDPDAEQNFRTPNPDGTWHYPELVVTYDTDDPEELVLLASADIHKYTRQVPTYEADVQQFAAAGMDAHGVELGDVVHIVDKKFGDAPLRIEARIVEMTVNELDESDVQLVIGEATQGIESAFKSMRSAIDAAEERSRRIEGGGTIVYLQHLLDEINAEINGTGGYSYLVPGEGIVTYDKRVADPLIGTEATQVTQIKGGNIRIANTKNPGFAGINDWEWKTVIVSGHVAAELVTAAHITAGYIGSSNDAVFLDFENHVFEIGNATTIGNTTVQQLLSDVASAGIDTIEYGTSASSATAPTSWSTTAPTSVAKGSWLWIRTTYKNGTISTTKAYAGTDGQDGADGADGVGIASTAIEYGTSADAATQPTTWSTTPPTSLPQATWLWVRTTYTYSDQSTKSVYTKSYVGTDGEDGASVYVASSTKSGDTTTVVLSDGTTLTIVDGEDGTNGTNGLNGYVHTAWANSADGSADFSTTVSANKLYLGVYTDNQSSDSQRYQDYAWSLIKGADGTSVTITGIEYGMSSSASVTPTSWNTTSPTTIANGTWLWARTTYSDGSTAITKSYVGTDGEDGTSVFVQSATKSGDTTTVVIADSDGNTSTLTIKDGEDGTNGAPGLSGYVHVAWATSVDGSQGFSTSVSAGKTYLGTYTDNTAADSQRYQDYSWSLIKGVDGKDGQDGVDGQDGADGIGIASVTPQYYLSTSSSSATGGSWSSNPPTWSADHYIWTRSMITWDTTPSTTTTTTEVYDEALTQANQQAVESAKVATDYITDGSSGTDFGKTGVSSKMRILPTGMEIFDGNGDSALFAGLQNSNSIVRVGKASGSGNVVMSSEGYVDVRNASTVMAHFGYGEGTNSSGGTSIAPYYDVGRRKSNTTVGNYSVAEGYLSTASGYCSHAEGADTTASGYNSHSEGNSTTASSSDSHAEGYYTKATKSAAHAEGYRTTASGNYSHAEGSYTTASGESTHTEGYSTKATGQNSHAEGSGTEANGAHQHVSGAYNVTHFYHLLIIGNGSADNARSNALYLSQAGNLWIAGTLTQNSDRRLKEHHAYLGEDASDFIRALKPALYTKDGVRHVGFYAQDVQAAEPEEWGTDTVTAQHTDESLDFDPLTLDYNALIAPLVAYAQQLEKRIDEQQEMIERLTKRLDALEGR